MSRYSNVEAEDLTTVRDSDIIPFNPSDTFAARCFFKYRCKSGIYVLALSNSCYYVGLAVDLYSRLRQHVGRKRRPQFWVEENWPIIGLLTFYPCEGELADKKRMHSYEYSVACACREAFGKDNVRGGPFVAKNSTVAIFR